MQDFLNKLKHFMDDRYGVDDLLVRSAPWA